MKGDGVVGKQNRFTVVAYDGIQARAKGTRVSSDITTPERLLAHVRFERYDRGIAHFQKRTLAGDYFSALDKISVTFGVKLGRP